MKTLLWRSESYVTRSIITLIILLGVISIITLTTWRPAIIVGGVLLFWLFILVLVKPDWLFTFVYPMLIIVGGISIIFFEFSFSLERILVLVGLAGVLGGIFLTKRIGLEKLPVLAFIGLAAWFCFYVISSILAPSYDSLRILLGYFQKIGLMYLVYVSLSASKKFLQIVYVYIFSGLVASLVTVLAYSRYGNLYIIYVASYSKGDSMLEMLFQGLARAGTGNVMWIWLSLLLIHIDYNKPRRFLWTLLVFWFGVVNLFALRREILITLPLGFLFLTWRNALGNRWRVLLIALLMTILGGLFISNSPEWQNRLFVETSTSFSEGLDPRTNMLLRFTPAAFVRSPWFGYGAGNYASSQFFFPEEMPMSGADYRGLEPHNAWSATLIEAGIFAFIGLNIFLYGLGRPLLTRPTTLDRQMSVLWLFAPQVFLQLLFTMTFAHGLTSSSLWFWFGFLLALRKRVQWQEGAATNYK